MALDHIGAHRGCDYIFIWSIRIMNILQLDRGVFRNAEIDFSMHQLAMTGTKAWTGTPAELCVLRIRENGELARRRRQSVVTYGPSARSPHAECALSALLRKLLRAIESTIGCNARQLRNHGRDYTFSCDLANCTNIPWLREQFNQFLLVVKRLQYSLIVTSKISAIRLTVFKLSQIIQLVLRQP
jgi:hypothetical protein